MYIFTPSIQQGLYQKIICFSNYTPIHITPNILSEEDIDIVIGEVINNKDFEKSNSEVETYENMEDLNFALVYEDGGIIKIDDLNEEEMNNP